MLITVGGLAYALGMRGILLLIVAFLGSGIISYFVLDRIRNNAGRQLGGFFHRINDRIDTATRAEDDDEDDATPTASAPPADSTALGAEPGDDTPAANSDTRNN